MQSVWATATRTHGKETLVHRAAQSIWMTAMAGVDGRSAIKHWGEEVLVPTQGCDQGSKRSDARTCHKQYA